MKNKWKSICSVIAIGIFGIFAAASFGPDKSTNTTVAISNCTQKPTVLGQLRVHLHIQDENGLPAHPTRGVIFIVHQKVNPDTTCTYTVITNDKIEFDADNSGDFIYQGSNWSHDNSEDLYRVEVKVTANSEFTGYDEVKVLKYATSDFNFICKVKKWNSL